MAGKGSKPRPIKDYKEFGDNFDSIFKKKTKPNEKRRKPTRKKRSAGNGA